MSRIRLAKIFLWSIVGLAAAVAVKRFLTGLGATTHLNDSIPWGLWVGFDVMGGVALAAGGFVITATVYVLNREDLHHLTRPAVLTAFLGYIAVAVGLLFDLGLPWHIWHPMVYWQHHSALFEVAWCVMLYLTVLALEFLPVPLESTSRFAKVRRFLVKYRMLLVAAGIMLSTLHQSSLGTLFLVMPFRVHELWYSPIIPILFFVSSVALGLMMICFESLVTGYLYRRKSETQLLATLSKATVWVLSVYLLLRFGDLLVRGEIGALFEGSWESGLFIVEILISAAIPIAILSHPMTRNKTGGIFLACTFGVSGFVLNRLSVGGITMLRVTEASYFPAWTEFAVSAGVVSGAALAFFFAVEHFNVWETPAREPTPEQTPAAAWARAQRLWLGSTFTAGMKVHSLAFVLACSLGFGLLAFGEERKMGVDATPVAKARGGRILRIDGNRDGFHVSFDHETHKAKLGAQESCKVCHHLKKPYDEYTVCSECHADMYLPVGIFDHDFHQVKLGGNRSCAECHPKWRNRSKETVSECNECHVRELQLTVEGAPIQANLRAKATSYTDAMHGLCVTCHTEIAERIHRPEHGKCGACHQVEKPSEEAPSWEKQQLFLSNRSVITTKLLSDKVDLNRYLVEDEDGAK